MRRSPTLRSRWDRYVVPGLGHPVRRRRAVGDRRGVGGVRDGARHGGLSRSGACDARRHPAPACRRTARTGPAGSSRSRSTGRSSTRPGRPPRSFWPLMRCPGVAGGSGIFHAADDLPAGRLRARTRVACDCELPRSRSARDARAGRAGGSEATLRPRYWRHHRAHRRAADLLPGDRRDATGRLPTWRTSMKPSPSARW